MKIRTKKGKSYSLEFIKNVFSDTLCAIIEKNKGRIINGAEKTIYQRIQGLEKWCEHLVKDDSAVASYLKTTDGKDNPIGGDWLSYKIQLSNYLKKEFPSVGSRQNRWQKRVLAKMVDPGLKSDSSDRGRTPVRN